MTERAHMIAQLDEIRRLCGASVSATNRTDALCTQLLARFDEQEATCKAQAQTITDIRASNTALRQQVASIETRIRPHPTVRSLRATIANLERDRDEKAAAIRSQEKECTRLRETVEHQRQEIGKLFARANECAHYKGVLADVERARDRYQQRATEEAAECRKAQLTALEVIKERDEARAEWTRATKTRDLAAEGQTRNARRLVAVVDIMRGLAFRAAAMLAHCDNQGWRGPMVEELRAALAKVPGPRDNLPMAPEHVTTDAQQGRSPGQDAAEATAILSHATAEQTRDATHTPPARCTCAYPLPTMGIGWDRINEIHAKGCPVSAGATMWYHGRPVIARPIPSGRPSLDYARPPYPRRAEVNPATMPDGARWPVTAKDTGEERACLKCGQPEGTAHLARCPWNLANR